MRELAGFEGTTCTAQFPRISGCREQNQQGEMSGGWTVPLLLIVACTLVTFAECARPLEDEELSAVILRLLETSQEIPSSARSLPPPQLSPAHRAVTKFTTYRKAPAPIEFKSEAAAKSTEESSTTSPRTEFERNAEQLQRRQYMYNYNSMLHKNPAGPNPIGNEYRPGNTMHNVKRYRSPPQG